MDFGFIGASYGSRSRKADGQRCVNLYPEVIESGKGKVVAALHGTPGLLLFSTMVPGSIPGGLRAIFASEENGGRLLAVAGNTLYDVDSAGTATSLGTVAVDSNPASISFNGTQYLIVSGGLGYILSETTLTQIADQNFPVAAMGVFLDGYFIVVEVDTQKFWISGYYAGTSWNGLDFGTAEAAPDNLKAEWADHGELWLFGPQTTEVFYNSGNLDFPIERIQGAVIEHGIEAPWSIAKCGDGLMWLSKDRNGHATVVRTSGFTPQRVSTHAVENAIQGYSNASIIAARAFTYQEEGHEFYCLSFPPRDGTWVYDLTTGLWHERGYWEQAIGFEASRAICHAFAFGKHIVGDRASGLLYQQSLDVYSDNGSAIRRMRRSPHISAENAWIFHSQLVMDMEVGVGLQTGQGSDPLVMMRFSDDGGFNWSNIKERSIGAAGARSQRVVWNRLGSSRDRVYEVSISDPVKVCFLGAYLNPAEAAA